MLKKKINNEVTTMKITNKMHYID